MVFIFLAYFTLYNGLICITSQKDKYKYDFLYVSFYSTEKHFIRTPVVEKQMYFPLQHYPVNNMVTGNLK